MAEGSVILRNSRATPLHVKLEEAKRRYEVDSRTIPGSARQSALHQRQYNYLFRRPAQPTTVVGPGDDLTDETGDYAETLYQQTLNQTGSVIGTVGSTGSYNWFTMGMLPGSNPTEG